jgi:surfeit locus 1 family protein
MRPLDLTRRGVLGTVAVLLVAGACIRLGFWQLERMEERRTRNAAVAERLEADRVALTRTPRDTAGLAYRRATVTGAIDDPRALILAGRSRNGAPGVHVLSPVRIGAGAVLVNRGWLPSPDAATADLDAVRLHGTVRAEGVLLPFPDVEREHDPEGFQATWFRFDGDAIRAQYPYPVAPLYLAATAVHASGPPAGTADSSAGSGEPAAGGAREGAAIAPAPLDPPSLDPGPHLSYAVQWFGFAAVFLVGWLVLLVRGAGRATGSDGAGGEPDGAGGER